MKKQHILLIVIAAVLVLAAVICLLPWPSRVHMTFNAVYTNNSGTSTTALGTVTVRATKLDYLLQNDKVFLDIDLPNQVGFDYREYENGATIYDYALLDLKDDYVVTNAMCYSTQKHNPGLSWIGYSAEDGMFVMSDPFTEGRYLVGSASGEHKASDILAYFPIITLLAESED